MKQTGEKNPEQEGESANYKWRLIERWGQREWTLWKIAKKVRRGVVWYHVQLHHISMVREWCKRRQREDEEDGWDDTTCKGFLKKLVCKSACWSLKYNRSCILIETGSIGWMLNKCIKDIWNERLRGAECFSHLKDERTIGEQRGGHLKIASRRRDHLQNTDAEEKVETVKYIKISHATAPLTCQQFPSHKLSIPTNQPPSFPQMPPPSPRSSSLRMNMI